MELEQQIGYLVAKMEEQGEDIKRMGTKLDSLEERVNAKFKTAELAFKTLKFLGLAVLAVASFKFGDLKSLWPF